VTAFGAFLKLASRCLLTLGAVCALTWITYAGLHVNSSTAAFCYLLLILALAARAGLTESIAASVASVLTYNYFFLPPIGTLTIADPQNWVALIVFLITAVTASHLSASARRRTQQADAREQEMHRLYDFSRALMLKDPDGTLASHAIRKLNELFGVSEAWFYDAAEDRLIGPSNLSETMTLDIFRQVARSGKPWGAEKGGALAVPVGLGGQVVGSLGVAGETLPSVVGLNSLAQLLAIALETSRAQESATRMEATRQNEQLKATLLDALAHEFKTPLTSIKAATTSLLPRTDISGAKRELLTIIDEETDRLNSLVSDSIELARIGSEPVTLTRTSCSLPLLVAAALCQLRILTEDRPVHLHLSEGLPPVYVDRNLTELVLRQLIGNALKYSPPSSPISISAENGSDFALIRIRNSGPGIPKNEQAAIFEKFYRSRDARRRIAGTGMGLAIAREIVEAHNGRIWVDSQPGEGAEFCFTLPFEGTERPVK
jgi:two-component system sensor histidine kinase KdpD